MSDSKLDIVGIPPQIIGKRCQALLCQQYWYRGKFTEAALNIFLRFDNEWHRLFLYFDTIFWRPQEEEPQSWDIPEEGFEYPIVNLGKFLQVEGTTLSDLISESTEAAIGARVTFSFDNGCVVIFENKDDRTHFLVTSADTDM